MVQPKMKCGKLSKYHRNNIKSGIYPSEKHEIFTEYSPCPETQNKIVSSSKGMKLMVCGLDHSGSQPFN